MPKTPNEQEEIAEIKPKVRAPKIKEFSFFNAPKTTPFAGRHKMAAFKKTFALGHPLTKSIIGRTQIVDLPSGMASFNFFG